MPDAVFLDNTGTPLPVTGEALTTPTFRLPLSSSEDRWRNYPSHDQRPSHLAQMLENADSGDPHDLFEFIEEMVEKDLKIRSAYRTRKTALLGTPWDVVPAEAEVGDEQLASEIASNVKRWISRADIRAMRKHQLDAIGKPFAVSWINWRFVTENGKLVVLPQSFTPMTGRRFKWNNVATVKANEDATDRLLYFENLSDREGKPLPPWATIRSLFNDQSDHPTRAGLLRGFVYFYAFKITSIKDWVSYVDKNGTPIRVITIRAEDFTPGPTFDLIRTSLRDLGTNALGIFPDSSKIEIHAPVGSVDVFKETCDYLDKAFAQAILGHELSSQSSPGPGQLGVTVAENVRQDVLEGDAEDYAPMERRDLYTPLVGFNYGWDVVERGLVPYLKFETEPPIDTKARVVELVELGRAFPDMPFSKQQFRNEFGIEPPVDFDVDTEDDEMHAKGPAPNPFGGGGLVNTGTAGDGRGDGVDSGNATGPRALAAQQLIEAAVAGERRLNLAPSQHTVDRIAQRGIDRSQSELLAMRGPIKALVAQAAEENWTPHELVEGTMRLFKQLDLRRTAKELAERRVMARLYGRTAKL
jgi:phage gp29-like protein